MKKINPTLITITVFISAFFLSVFLVSDQIGVMPQNIADTAMPFETAPDASCPQGNCRVSPVQYPVGWIPWIADFKSWRNYDPSSIAGLGRLVPSPDGSVTGEILRQNICEKLTPGKYTFVMKYQNDERPADYMSNTDILYLKTQEGLGHDYIRHSQVAGGYPTFCAGEFHVGVSNPFERLTLVNEIVEVNNFSGHYKPECKCLGVLEEKLNALNIDTQYAKYNFMGHPKDCR